MTDRRTKHGGSRSAEYRVWIGMRRRCSNPDSKAFVNYGARGITVCPRWDRFENFIDDMGPRPTPQHTLERIDNDLGYGPDNCRWATRAEQQRNRRNNVFVELGGERMCLMDAARRLGLSYATLRSRLQKLPPEEALRPEKIGRGAGFKLTADEVAQIRAEVARGLSHRKAAARFGVSKTMVGMIVRGTSWRQ